MRIDAEIVGFVVAVVFLLVWPHVLIIFPMNLIGWLRSRLDFDEVRRGYTRALLEQLALQTKRD
jgi:hypothetical protein